MVIRSSGHHFANLHVVIRSSGHHFANLHVVIRSSGHHFANYIGHHFQRTLELISIPTQTAQHIQFCFHLFNICVLDPSRVQHILDPSRVVNICNYVFPCVLEFNIWNALFSKKSISFRNLLSKTSAQGGHFGTVPRFWNLLEPELFMKCTFFEKVHFLPNFAG